MTDRSEQFDLYVSFDIETHTIDALELILEKLQQVRGRPTAWKWAVVGLHSAILALAAICRRSEVTIATPGCLRPAAIQIMRGGARAAAHTRPWRTTEPLSPSPQSQSSRCGPADQSKRLDNYATTCAMSVTCSLLVLDKQE